MEFHNLIMEHSFCMIKKERKKINRNQRSKGNTSKLSLARGNKCVFEYPFEGRN